MRIMLVTTAAMVLAALVGAACSGATKDHAEQSAAKDPSVQAALASAAQQARQSFADTAPPSMDELIDRFLWALRNKDKAALNELRVNKTEYVDLIIPGTVPVGQPPRNVSQQPKEYYWSMLDTRSRYYADAFVHEYGGRTYQSHTLRFDQKTKDYAWYTAHGQVRLELYADDGKTYHLITGWVAEVDGKYKFIGYNYDT